MDENRLTFIGRAEITDPERDILVIFGRGLSRLAVNLTVVPRGQANEAVIAGVEQEGGVVNKIDRHALKAPRDGLVIYAEPALLDAIAISEPDLDLDLHAVVINNIDELHQYVEALLAAVWRVQNAAKPESPETE